MKITKIKYIPNQLTQEFIESLAESLKYAVQDELDLGSTWDKRLSLLENDFKHCIKDMISRYFQQHKL